VSPRISQAAAGIVLLLVFYGFLVFQGIPQKWTQEANQTVQHDAVQHEQQRKSETANGSLPLWTVLPFAAILLSIAVLPLIHRTAEFWESNAHKFYIAAGLSVIILLYYGLFCNLPVDLHFPAHRVVLPEEGGFELAKTVFINAVVSEFVPFIILLFSLFTISGGIRISGNLKASPAVNSMIFAIGAVTANIIGTTGAAMLLVRLLLETNQERKYKVHTIIIFIFVVCNCGGCLTPLGDPPLFLGYLRGVEFTWTLFNLWEAWLFVNFALIAVYFLWDTLWYYRKESAEDKAEDDRNVTSVSVQGWQINVPLLLGVVAAVAFLDPGKTFPGTDWHPWFFLREAMQLLLCALSLFLTSRKIREANSFNFIAIGEVAALFFGIFITMQAPLQILNAEGKNLVAYIEKNTGVPKPYLFFWSTGTLSSVLDNAPTYVVFFETAKALSPNSEEELKVSPEWKEEYEKGNMVKVNGGFIDKFLLIAISLGAVFMGAMTYIGNGPNFMVKAIAEQSGVKMPSFFGYMVYSFLLLLPLLIIMTLIFI